MSETCVKILAISGSLRTGSSNTALLSAAATLFPENTTFKTYEGLADLPHFSPELDGDDSPVPVKNLRALLQEADGVLICTPEYAYGMPGVLKNALDWTVSTGEFAGKPVVAISASPYSTGGAQAHASLVLTLSALAANTVEPGSLIVPFVRTKLGANGDISDPATAQSLRALLGLLVKVVKRLMGGDL
ncbi:MAG: NAD(P)H-dependent oxidoreductase [Gemmatimonadaceae bacterium]|nr:NAD(P)H-dependent oxidoreductase [Gloeobacterales cyanobacterium ES-bin-141]